VFDGTQTPHTETEPFSPLSVYGQSKAAGDLVVSLLPKHYILRTSWVIGEGKNFVRTMLSLGEKGIAPTVVADQIGRLTFTSTLVSAIHHLLSTQSPYGTYNVTNSGESASWAEITRQIFKLAGYKLTVTDTTTDEYYAGKPGIAPRPLQSTLDLSKIEGTGFHSTDWHEDLADYIKKEQR
jgi:dTDP-4-dehydrorhamnose 3,5-epimerase